MKKKNSLYKQCNLVQFYMIWRQKLSGTVKALNDNNSKELELSVVNIKNLQVIVVLISLLIFVNPFFKCQLVCLIASFYSSYISTLLKESQTPQHTMIKYRMLYLLLQETKDGINEWLLTRCFCIRIGRLHCSATSGRGSSC